MTKKKQKGFTLIELAIIIAILGILGAVGAVKFANLQTQAKVAGAYSAVDNARSALSTAIASYSGNVSCTTDLLPLLEGGSGCVDSGTTSGTFTLEQYIVTFDGDGTGTAPGITDIATASHI